MSVAMFHPDARAALEAVEGDPRRRQLASRLNETLDLLEADPSDAIVRRHRFLDPPAWAAEVRGRDEEWWIVWERWDAPNTEDDGVPYVIYIGPAP